MKKLLTFSLAFMLAVLFNTNAIAQTLVSSVSPAGGEVTEISEIIVSFDQSAPGNNIKASESGIFDEQGNNFNPNINQKFTRSDNNKNYHFKPESGTITTPGTYTFKLAAGSIYTNMMGPYYGDYGSKNEYIEVVYIVVDAPKAFAFEGATPASGSVVDRIDEIVVDFAAESVLTGSATVDVAGVQATFAPTATPGQVKATLAQAVTAEGNYTITIPEGAFTAADGTSNEAVTLNYTIEYPEMNPGEITISPANGSNVVGLNTIIVEFPQPITVNDAAGAITLSNGATIENIEINKYSAIITANAASGWQLGQYTLNIPKGYFVGSSSKNPALSYSWNIIAATLDIDDFSIRNGETKEVAVKLTGDVDFTAFQADITLPAGLEVVGDFVLNRGVDHVLTSRVQSNGAIRLLSYSLTNKNYTGNSGDAFVTFQVKAADDFRGNHQIAINGITFTTSAGNEFELEAATANVEGLLFVSSIEINPTSLNLETGEEARLEATVYPQAADNLKVTWSTTSKDIVEVDEEGKVVAKAAGQAEIIATAQDGSGVTASIPVTVVYTHAGTLTITPAEVFIEVDQRQTLTAEFDKVTNKAGDLVWSSDNEAVAVVEITDGVVEVVGKSLGEANITAQIKNGEEVVLTNTIKVKVDATVATTVTIEPAELTLETGQKFTFTANVNKEATNKNVVWTSSDPTKVSINETTGEVEALALTDAPVIITATADDGGGAFGTAEVTVVESLATGIVLNITEAQLEATGDADGQVQLTATVTPPTNKNIVWKSSNEAVATVVDGLVTAIAVGEADITATIEGTALSATCKVTVVPTYATSIVINYEGATQFETGAEADIQLVAIVAPSYVTDSTVAWTSSDNEIATVNAEGKVTIGEKPGKVTITATANGAKEGAEVAAAIEFDVVYTFATTISIDQEAVTLKANETEALTVTIDNATNKGLVWETSNAAVATVDAEGKVTAIGVGQATITVTIEGTEIKDTVDVTVAVIAGDVNNDAIVDVADVTAIAGHILGDEVDPFIEEAANLNNDEKINVTDIVLLVNIILTQEEVNDAQQAAINRARQNVDNSNSLSIEDFEIMEGETQQIAIRLNNSDAFTAFQADIYLPEGLEICQQEGKYDMVLSARKSDDHVLASAPRNNGSVRMLSYSLGLNEYTESDGDFIYLTVKATEGFIGDFQIEIDNITFVQANQTKCYFAPVVSNVKGTEYVSVEGVEGDELVVKVVGNTIVAPEGAEVYDLNGIKVNADNLSKGIYIVKVGNQVVKVII